MVVDQSLTEMLSSTQTGRALLGLHFAACLMGYHQPLVGQSIGFIDDDKSFKFLASCVWERRCMFVLAPFARFLISSPGHGGLSVTQRSAVCAANTQKQTPSQIKIDAPATSSQTVR